jgi:predicted component of type VI protein secretion system
VIKFSADGIACIRDEDSLNGTFVNDELLPPGLERRLTAKDQFRLGEATIGHVRIAAGPAEGNHS